MKGWRRRYWELLFSVGVVWLAVSNLVEGIREHSIFNMAFSGLIIVLLGVAGVKELVERGRARGSASADADTAKQSIEHDRQVHEDGPRE